MEAAMEFSLVVLISLPFLKTSGTAQPIPTSFVRQLSRNILEDPFCDQLDLLLDNSIPHDFLDISTLVGIQFENTAGLINLPLDYQLNTSDVSEVYRFYWNTRFWRLCTLSLSLLPARNDSVSEFTIRRLPGAPHRSFFVFLVNEIEDAIEGIRQSARYLQNILLVHRDGDSLLSLSTRNWNFESLYPVAQFNIESDRLEVFESLFPKVLDFHGAEVLGLVCPLCEPAYTTFKETGIWRDFMIATMYEMCLRMNATLELESVFELPGTGVKEDGTWDDFVMPLVDGSALFTAIVRPNIILNKAVGLVHVIFFDDIGFIHALPKRQEFSSLSVLAFPFEFRLWMCIVGIILFSYPALLVFAWYRRWKQQLALKAVSTLHVRVAMERRVERVAILQILVAFLMPTIDQTGLSDSEAKKFMSDSFTRCAFSLWFLSLIVIGCGYKSAIISAIVLPRYEYPPRTFQQLVDSDYQIGAMFYTNQIEVFFRGKNDRISSRVVERAREYAYFNEECYHLILQPKQVCIGLVSVFQALAPEFLTNENGKLLFMAGLDSYFYLLGTIGLSRFHLHIHEPFEFLMYSTEQSGIALHMFYMTTKLNKDKGRAKSAEWRATKPAFRSENYFKSEDNSNKQLVMISLKILALGSIAATVSFLVEVPIGFTQRWRSSVSVLF